MREAARFLECNYKTVYRKYKWMGLRAKEFHNRQKLEADTVLFDEQESIEHTKLKEHLELNLYLYIAKNNGYKFL